MSIQSQNIQSQNIQNELLPMIDHLSDIITPHQFELLRSHPAEFFALLEFNMYVYILKPETKEWIQYRMYSCKPPYAKLRNEIHSYHKNLKLSTICLSSLVANYPPQRSIVLFDSMARVNGMVTHPIFQQIAGGCLIIPLQLTNWPEWDIQFFPWLFPPPK
uniref:Uncharacterized protein n=1 Tax=viral metagenome TaxID=1070528 RepID=A0A6C0KHE3_9ZZZZ